MLPNLMGNLPYFLTKLLGLIFEKRFNRIHGVSHLSHQIIYLCLSSILTHSPFSVQRLEKNSYYIGNNNKAQDILLNPSKYLALYFFTNR
jgi:hypothetical protein